jgi:histidinol-phosphate aminotransferase
MPSLLDSRQNEKRFHLRSCSATLENLIPYSSARDDFKGQASVYLDANENPFDNGLNRYPDPHQSQLKDALSRIKGISVQNIFIGNGSDEVIDLLFRGFCEPGIDNVITLPPTYGMYKVSAKINNVDVREVLLDEFFDVDVDKVLSVVGKSTKVVFLCSPNNPTGNSLSRNSIKRLLREFQGIVVVDEAYIDFSTLPSLVSWIQEFPNLVVLQTLSKAWGLASARIGLCIANEKVISILNQIKPPYNVSGPDQQEAQQALSNESQMKAKVKTIKQQRKWLADELNKILKLVFTVYPSDANFLLIKVNDANKTYKYLSDAGIIVRNRSKEPNCENCLRITVGTESENQKLIQTLKTYVKENIIH